jgi:hypothetical protein
MAPGLFMNGTPYRRSCGWGRAFQDRRKQGCLREAPMDGFTAFLESPPPSRGSANHHVQTFMNQTLDRIAQ